jgi:predicted metal-dependent hydrolase
MANVKPFSDRKFIDWYKKLSTEKLIKWFTKIQNYKKLEEVLFGFVIINKKFTEDDYESAGINKIDKSIMGECDYKYKVLLIDVAVHKNLAQLIDTIAHEIAHIKHDNHGKDHKYYTILFKKVIKTLILEEYLEVLKAMEGAVEDEIKRNR